MLRKIFTNKVVLNTIILFVLTFSLELIIRGFSASAFLEWSTFRIGLSSLMLALGWSYITHFFPNIVGRILNIIYVLFIGIYDFVEFGLYNYLGFYMGVGNSEQGTKVMGYINDFIHSLKPYHWTLLIPTVLIIIYYIVFDRLIRKHNNEKSKLTLIQKIYIEVVTLVLIVSIGGCYFLTVKSKTMTNELQTESNYSLWVYPENSNLTVNNYGAIMYGFIDLKSNILGVTEYVDPDQKVSTNDNKNDVITDKSRIIDDTAWNMLIDSTSDSERNELNNYFIHRSVTKKNDYTGIFKDKNLIIVMLESTNEIPILNSNDFPTISKLYNEGISFRNNYTPRNNCSTGNNEFTVLSSLFTINNTCTANTYASNQYFEAAFNIFNNAGYYTTSYHDYTQKYYKRNKIHTNLGSQKFYGVTDLGMSYDDKYEEWPSDVTMFENAKQYYMTSDKFMSYFATVSTHQTYNVSSELGDKYTSLWGDTSYSLTLKRYLSKMHTLDEALAKLLEQLEDEGKLDDTVIALFADHYPYGLTDGQINEYLSANGASYSVNHNSTKDKDVDRTPMIIYNSTIDAQVVEDYTSIIDLLPTLMNMFDLEYDPRLYLGHDIFAEDYEARAVFADGSWADEKGFYYAPSSKITYFDETNTYTNEELKAINSEISQRQKMSASAIKSNYFKYLGDGLAKYQAIVDEQNKKEETTTTTTETEE